MTRTVVACLIDMREAGAGAALDRGGGQAADLDGVAQLLEQLQLFLRDDAWQGLPATADRSAGAPPFDRQQWAGSAGGPIRRSRAWWFGVFARNVLDTDYITGGFSAPLPAFGGQPGEPRQIGVQFDVDFAPRR